MADLSRNEDILGVSAFHPDDPISSGTSSRLDETKAPLYTPEFGHHLEQRDHECVEDACIGRWIGTTGQSGFNVDQAIDMLNFSLSVLSEFVRIAVGF